MTGEPVKARIHITLKPGILDPQGKTIQQALHALGYGEIAEVRAGKLIELKLDGVEREHAGQLVEAACQKLLANPVMEDYQYSIVEDNSSLAPEAKGAG